MCADVPEIRTTILVIDDEADLRKQVKSAFATDRYRIYEAVTGEEGIALAGKWNPNLIFTEMALPDMRGLEVIRCVREWSPSPIIVLSQEHEQDRIVEALEAGANDYIVKPFGLLELGARTRAKLRTADWRLHEQAAPVIVLGPLRLDLVKHQLDVDRVPVHLTPIEYRLVALLMRHEPGVVSHKDLIDCFGGTKGAVNRHGVRVYIGYLRGKLKRVADRVRIVNEPRIGYRLVAAR